MDGGHSSTQMFNSPSLYTLFLPLEGFWNVAGVADGVGDIPFPPKSMDVGGEVFGEEVAKVGNSSSPEDNELAKSYSILDPMEPNSSWLKTPNPDGLVCGVGGSGVITPDFCGYLRIAEVVENVLENAGLLGHNK